MVSPLHCDGSPWSRAAHVDGISFERTDLRHRQTYAELVNNPRAKLLILGNEVFGRWNQATLDILPVLTALKARDAPSLLTRSASSAWHRRWINMLSVASQVAVSETLMDPKNANLTELGGDPPPLGDVLAWGPGSADPSRLPPR